MSETRYSLCLSYLKLNYPDQFSYFRIADYEPNTHRLFAATYSQDEEFSLEPRQIGFHPKDMEPFSTTIRKWYVDEYEPRKTRSFSYHLEDNERVFEIVFPPELKGVGSQPSQIRNVLKEGITIDENACEDLLIVISSTKTHHFVIRCKKGYFKKTANKYCLSQNISDMVHTVHVVDAYNINLDSIINSERSGIRTQNNEPVCRFFYNSTVLPENHEIFNLYSIEEYIPQYLSSYLKKQRATLQVSNTIIQNIISVIQSALNDRDGINNYFFETGYSEEELLNVMPEFSEIVSEALMANGSVNDTIAKCVFNNEAMLAKCVELARKDWLSKKDEERLEIENSLAQKKQELKSAESSIKKADRELSDIIINIEEKKSQLSDIRREITIESDNLNAIRVKIDEALLHFSDSIVDHVRIAAIAKSVSNNSTMALSRYKKTISVYKEETIDDKDDFEEILQDNLESIGYGTFSMQIAQLLTFSFSNSLPVVIANNSKKIVESIAATFKEKCMTIIKVPLGFSNDMEIIDVIKQSEGVCFIIGAFDGCNDSLFSFIADYFDGDNKHFIIFGADGIQVDMISESVWNKALFLDGSIGYGTPLDKGFTSVVDNVSFTASYDSNELKKHRNWLKYFVDNKAITTIRSYTISKFMYDIDFDETNDILIWLQLCLSLNSNNIDSVLDKIDNSSLKEKYSLILKGFIER